MAEKTPKAPEEKDENENKLPISKETLRPLGPGREDDEKVRVVTASCEAATCNCVPP
ncbi:MAG TPA: hypothetical protein VH877_28140 [Polyangia bacterium]|jgi:hypothetical protein|nr:hypothetical protein [Polyangia bacterium]